MRQGIRDLASSPSSAPTQTSASSSPSLSPAFPVRELNSTSEAFSGSWVVASAIRLTLLSAPRPPTQLEPHGFSAGAMTSQALAWDSGTAVAQPQTRAQQQVFHTQPSPFLFPAPLNKSQFSFYPTPERGELRSHDAKKHLAPMPRSLLPLTPCHRHPDPPL